MVAILVSIYGYFNDYTFMDVLKTSATLVAGFYSIFIVGMLLVFIMGALRN